MLIFFIRFFWITFGITKKELTFAPLFEKTIR